MVIPHLVAYIHEQCGVALKNLVILVANGTHIGGDEAELRTLVTEAVYNAVRVVNHDCLADDLVLIGATSRKTQVEVNPLAVGRKVIALGAATQHVMAGYGGGRKSILPGICSMRSSSKTTPTRWTPARPAPTPPSATRCSRATLCMRTCARPRP